MIPQRKTAKTPSVAAVDLLPHTRHSATGIMHRALQRPSTGIERRAQQPIRRPIALQSVDKALGAADAELRAARQAEQSRAEIGFGAIARTQKSPIAHATVQTVRTQLIACGGVEACELIRERTE